MKYTNLFEKLIGLFNVTKDSGINLIFLGIILLFGCLTLNKKVSKRLSFIISTISIILLGSFVIIDNYKVLGKTFDNIMDNLFTNIYFPSTYVYLFIFLFMNIAIIGNLINIKSKSSYKTINGIYFVILNFIFVLILELISNKKIDIFKKTSLFSNTNLVILLELSVMIFVLWLISLAVIYLSSIITERIILSKEKADLKEKNLISDNTLEVNIPEVETKKVIDNIPSIKEETTYSYHFIPTMPNNSNKQVMIENMLNNNEIKPTTVNVPYNEVKSNISTVSANDTFDLSSLIPRQQENHVIAPPSNSNNILDKILTNSLPYVEDVTEQKAIDAEKNTYTLNDYRLFNKMLKDIKEHNQSNSITIDKNLEYRLITKYSSENYDLFKRMLKNYSN